MRADDGTFLRDDAGGYLAWDPVKRGTVRYDSGTRLFDGDWQSLALRGEVEIDGTACAPAFELFARACADWTPEAVEHESWVPATELRAAAATLAGNPRLAYYAWSGVGQHDNASQTDRAIALLEALTGSYDAPGGNVVFAKPPVNAVNLAGQADTAKALGIEARPLGPPAGGWVTAADMYDAVLGDGPYKVEALVGFGGNMAVTQADPDRAAEALAALPFHVHCEMVETATARYADILLPIASTFEREALRIGFEAHQAAEEWVQLRPAAVLPRGEARSDMQVVFDLAVRLGMGNRFFDGDTERGFAHILEPLGLRPDDLRARPEGLRIPLRTEHRKFAAEADGKARGFDTDTGLVEIYPELLLRHGQAPLPGVEGAAASVDLPLILTTTKVPQYCHSEFRDIARLRDAVPDPLMEISPDLASDRGLAGGDWAQLVSAAGVGRFRVKLNASLDARVVVAQFGWDGDGANVNALIDPERRDPISGSAAHRSTRCDVRAI